MFGPFRKLRISTVTKSKIILCLFSFTLGYFFHFLLSTPPDRENENISKSFLLPVPKYNNADTFLIIFIFSSINNFSRRQSLRDTWVSDVIKNTEVKYYFVVNTGNAQKEQKNLLTVEQNNFNDLLILPNLEDSFFMLTSKLLAAFEWAVGTNQSVSPLVKPFSNFKFLLKCDDDSYVRVNEILQELHTKYSNENGLYWGFFDGRARVKNSGKYKEVEWNICDHYIPYALGGGYVLSQSLVEYIAKNEVYLKKYKNEDVTVGAWLASYSNINRVHDPRFDTEYVSRGCHQTYLITHKHSEAAMRNFYKNLKTLGHLCQKEFKTRMSYVYNWEVAPSKCCARINPNIP